MEYLVRWLKKQQNGLRQEQKEYWRISDRSMRRTGTEGSGAGVSGGEGAQLSESNIRSRI